MNTPCHLRRTLQRSPRPTFHRPQRPRSSRGHARHSARPASRQRLSQLHLQKNAFMSGQPPRMFLSPSNSPFCAILSPGASRPLLHFWISNSCVLCDPLQRNPHERLQPGACTCSSRRLAADALAGGLLAHRGVQDSVGDRGSSVRESAPLPLRKKIPSTQVMRQPL